MSEDYQAFLASKAWRPLASGYDDEPEPHPNMFPFQRDAFAAVARLGRSAAFLDTGLGKTLLQLHWAETVLRRENAPVLVLAPLAVGQQTVREAEKFGIDARYVRDHSEIGTTINVTNYERLGRFDPSAFVAVVPDESSILKSFDGKTRNALVDAFSGTRFRLCCTATPAPNDYTELGNHSAFLSVLSMNDMLHRWFINDTAEASQSWRLKRHGAADFWSWVASWAFCLSKPSDLGYPDDDFALPPLNLTRHLVEIDITEGAQEALFRMEAVSSTGLYREKRLTMQERVERTASIVGAEPAEPWVVWCETNAKADLLRAAMPGAIEVRGSMPPEEKEAKLVAFSEGKERVLITKPKIAGHGMNWQHCARMAFVGLSYSYEQFYQTVRRCWRYGQNRPVEVHVCVAPTELGVWNAITRKKDDHEAMRQAMLAATRAQHGTANRRAVPYEPKHEGRLPSWLRSA